jgi:hypothetical protein
VATREEVDKQLRDALGAMYELFVVTGPERDDYNFIAQTMSGPMRDFEQGGAIPAWMVNRVFTQWQRTVDEHRNIVEKARKQAEGESGILKDVEAVVNSPDVWVTENAYDLCLKLRDMLESYRSFENSQ